MQPIGGSAYNPGLGQGSFGTGVAASGGVVILHNFSPYDIALEFNGDATRLGFLPAWTYRTYDFKGAQTNTISYSVYFAPTQDAINAAPSSYIFGEAYASGEVVPDAALNYSRVANIGNGVQLTSASDTFEMDFLTPFILSGLTPSFTGFNLYSATAGIAFLIQPDSSIKRQSYSNVVQNLNYVSSTVYHDINPDGTFSIGTSHSTQNNHLTVSTIVFDNTGQITSVTDTRTLSTTLFPGFQNVDGAPGLQLYNLHAFKRIQSDDQIAVQGTFKTTSPNTGFGYIISIGANDELMFMPTGSSFMQGIVFYATSSLGPPSVELPLFSIGSSFNVGGTWIDTNGSLHSISPPNLASGYQETGTTGCYFQAAAGSSFSGGPTNFKTVMTNTPSSISISNSAIQNVSSTGIEKITFYGFTFFAVSTAAGITKWEGTYTTVGNCLLKVDAILGVFDHHCDGCGNVTTSNPISILENLTPDSLSYTCSKCGMQECFNTDLTQEDENDQTVQGKGDYKTTKGAQATMIRSLMTMIGMKTA